MRNMWPLGLRFDKALSLMMRCAAHKSERSSPPTPFPRFGGARLGQPSVPLSALEDAPPLLPFACAAAEEDEAAEAMEVVDDNRSGIGKSCFESTSTPPARLTPRISCIPSSSMRIVCTRDSKSLRFFLGGGAGPSLYARSAAGRCFSAISPRGPACGGLRPLMTTAPSSGGVARARTLILTRECAARTSAPPSRSGKC